MVNNNILAIKEVLKGTQIEETCLIILFNEYCDRNNYDYRIHYMSEFPEMTEGSNILDIISSLDKDFDADDEYFYIDGYGDYCSSNNAEDIIEDNVLFSEFAKSISENWYAYNNVLPIVYKYDITTGVKDLFLKWAENEGKVPMEWLECNVDEENTVVMDWDEYLEELAEDFKSETEDED